MKKRVLSLFLALSMVLSLVPASVFAAEIPDGAPFTAITTDKGDVIAVAEETPVMFGNYSDVGYYHVTISADVETVYVTYNADIELYMYADTTAGYIVSVPDLDYDYDVNAFPVECLDDGTKVVAIPVESYLLEEGEGSGIALEDVYFVPVNLFTFEYGERSGDAGGDDEGNEPDEPTEPEESTKPFLSIKCSGVEIEAGKIIDKGLFNLGDAYAGDDDNYNYVHEDVPYYHVIVPLGTTYVEVTYSADSDIMYVGSDAYGYTTDMEVDLVSSATVRNATFENGYTKNEDGTQTVKFPVVAYQFNNEGVGKAITLEGSGEGYPALNLFTFAFDGHTHDYEVVVKAPTCINDGYTTNTCDCGHNYISNMVASAGQHNYVEDPAQGEEATCAAAGKKVFICSECDDIKTETVPQKDHTYGAGQQTKNPTCKETGVMTYTCTVCPEGTDGHIKTETVAKLNEHNYGGAEVCPDCGTVNPDYVDPDLPMQDENGVYQIATAENLIAFAKHVNKGNTNINAQLTADIDLTGKEWLGIGISGAKFAGSFDGQNHTVMLNGSTFGLFGYVMGTWNSSNFSAKKLAIIKDVTIAGSVKNSALAHVAGYARITNCTNKADVTATGNSYVAGIVGSIGYALQYNSVQYSDVLIENCINEGNINGDSFVAGILGEGISGTRINGCANIGAISGTKNVGGIVGYLKEYKGTCEIKNSYNHGNVSGSSCVGGIVGNLYNYVEVSNCYNVGDAPYGIAGNVYNNTASINNSYYLASKASMGIPENTESAGAADLTKYVAVSKNVAEITSEDFAALLGDAFQQSCPGPVFTWQTPADHRLDADNVCVVCGLGIKQIFNVTMTSGEGYTITGESTVKEGENYRFTVTINDGYQKAESGFSVKVNGDTYTSSTDQYVVVGVEGPLSITVSGVEKIPDFFQITLPKTGNGYAVVLEEGCTTTVARNDSYSFTVAFTNGFRSGEDFTVKVNGKAVTADENALYTVENVIKAQEITVSGVEMIPYEDTVDVSFTITQGETQFHVAKGTNRAVVMETMEVPYFDIELYDLERYYYNPYCYVDKDGNPVNQSAGNKETAYGVVTAMHAYIYATEVYYLGYDPADACKGLSHQKMESNGKSEFDNAVSWTQGAGSSFMNLWSFGTNLNYYVNYMYPLGRPAWGSTSDQIPMKDGDVISVHLIEGSASGSNFAFFTVNDEDLSFDFSEDQVDEAVVDQFDKITLTMYRAGPNGEYITGYSRMMDEQLYWVEEKNFHYDLLARVESDEELDEEEAEQLETIWKTAGFAGMSAAEFVTDKTGCITIDASKLTPGTYYIATRGGKTPGGMVDTDGFVSAGNETGMGLFKLVVEACQHEIAQAEAKAPTCTEAGWEAYEYCTVEGCDYTTFVEKAALGHALTHVAEKTATYTETGLKEHWICSVCSKLFADAQGEVETSKEAVIVPIKERPDNDRRPSSGSGKTETKVETEVVKNEDGSTTTIVSDKSTGETVETTETKQGVTGTVITDKAGNITAMEAEIPTSAARQETVVVLPVTVPVLKSNRETASLTITIEAKGEPVRVAIPVTDADSGTVAVIVAEDGTEEIVKTSVLTGNGLELTLSDSATVKVVDNSKYFADVHGEDHWSQNSIDFVAGRQLFNGTSADRFSPDATMTRGMLLTVLARLADVETEGGSIWYEKGVAWAVENGLSDGSAAEGSITREQLAVILFRYAQMQGMHAVTLEENLMGYTDGTAISNYAVQAMNWAVGKGIVTGITGSELAPQGSATRAQVATMLHRFCLLMAQTR